MNVEEVLEFLEELNVLELVESFLYKEKRLIEEVGNPTSSRYDKTKEFLKLISELTMK